jgi:hypothetical protein
VSNTTITYLVVGCAGALGLGAYVAFILVPAWRAYWGVWGRLAAAFLSLYVVAAFVGLGVVGGAAVVWFWDRISTSL